MDRKQRSIIATMWVLTAVVAVGISAAVWVRSKNAAASESSASHVMTTEAPAFTEPLPILFDAPSFALIDQDGKPFVSNALHGKVWVADFVFTTCKGLCPVMTQRMVSFQKATPGSPVQMVSFSVDPEHDTPAVLKEYAQAARADESRWHFLTGTQAQTWEVSKGMKLAVGPDKGNQVMHSSHLLLVDGNGKVRGVYDSEGAGFDVKKSAQDANLLALGASH